MRTSCKSHQIVEAHGFFNMADAKVKAIRESQLEKKQVYRHNKLNVL